MSRHWFRIFYPAALLLAAGTLSTARAEESSVFVDRVDVNIVGVEVFVTDKRGKHVQGLTVDDFEIFEDGQPVPIANFYKVARQPPSQEAATPRETVASGETQSAPVAPPETLPPEQRLHLLVYLDNFNIRPGNRERVLSSLDGFLEGRTVAGDRVMLVTYDRGIEALQTFTDDPRLITSGLEKIRQTRANGLTEDLRRRVAAKKIADALRDPRTAGSAQAFLNSYIDETRANLLHSTKAIKSVLRSLAGVPGRKALLYVSDGLPQRPGEQLAEQFFGGQSVRMNETTLFKEVIQEANAQQVTLYTLDARGSVGSFSTAEYTDDAAGGINRVALDAARTINYQGALMDMSIPTGGTAFLNTYNFDAVMDTMAKDFDVFYSLGYNSPSTGDGRYHSIEVKVNRPGLTIRHRSGFFDKPAVEKVADQTLASLLVGMEKNPLGIQLEFEKPQKKGQRYLLPTMIRIPIRDLTLLPNGEVEEGKLRIFLVVQDEDGGLSPLQDFPYPLQIPSDKLEEARGSAIGHVSQLEIRAGTQKVAVGVWDEISGTESFAYGTVVVGKSKRAKKSGR